jgi:hypothetical protein
MRWITRPEWGPILLGALAGALAVPFIPFVIHMLRSTLLFLPLFCIGINGLFLAAAIGLVTWRLMMAGFIEVNERGLVLVGYQRNEKVPWEQLSKVDFAGPGKKAKARFYLTDKRVIHWGFIRTPRQDFIRMQQRFLDPILSLAPGERRALATALLEEHARDDLVQTVIRVYAGLLVFVGISLACLL